MKDLPSRDRRTPAEQAADATAMQVYMSSHEKIKPIKYILEGGELKPVVPGDRDYNRALPIRYDRQTGMPIFPDEPEYEKAAKNKPRRFR